jgi:hypothetical protein
VSSRNSSAASSSVSRNSGSRARACRPDTNTIYE